MSKITHCVYSYTLCVKLHTVYNGTLSRVLFALIVNKFPSVNFFYISAAIDAMDKYQVCKRHEIWSHSVTITHFWGWIQFSTMLPQGGSFVTPPMMNLQLFSHQCSENDMHTRMPPSELTCLNPMEQLWVNNLHIQISVHQLYGRSVRQKGHCLTLSVQKSLNLFYQHLSRSLQK